MSNKPDEIEDRFRQLEQEIYTRTEVNSEPVKRAETDRDSPISSFSIQSIFSWIDQQTGVTKIAAIAVFGIGGFMILSFLFKLISWAISLAIFSVVLFVLYKIFFDKSSTDPNP
jgi:hypothetical protein